MARLIVRAPLAGDVFAGLRPLWGDPLDEDAPGCSPASLVIARDSGLVGLACAHPTPSGRRIDRLFTAGASPRELLGAIAGALPDERIELLARDADISLERDAERAGYQLVHRQIAVRASLSGVGRPARRLLTFRSYEEVGRRGMLALLDVLWDGGSGPNRLATELELEHFLTLACVPGERPDTSLWRVAYHGGEPLGAMLGLRLAHDLRTAVLLYIGVLPHQRGRGLGSALHREALWAMRSLGVEHYEDSTGHDNAAMRRIFARAGCQTVGSSVLLARGAACVPQPALGTTPRRLPLGAHVSLLRKVPCARPPPD